jgi:F0F1-type ATP synthase delta subunit
MLNIDGKIVQNPQTLAETFNKYFSHTVEESVIKTLKQNENDPYIQSHLNYIVDAYPKPIPPI